MTIVSHQDFLANQDRYFDLAMDEQVAVKKRQLCVSTCFGNSTTQRTKNFATR
ncbi:MAG: hypothetical protein FWG79_09180 [Bacteroidales bacterium]|nr:hypothetical protein [Bacteroidales bacterium]